MKNKKALRALGDSSYDYYRLTQDLAGIVPKGAIFVHDPDDTVYGSIAEGCLKLCWTPDGDCYRGKDASLCGGTVIFHHQFAFSSLFEKVDRSELIKELPPGKYSVIIDQDGTLEVKREIYF